MLDKARRQTLIGILLLIISLSITLGDSAFLPFLSKESPSDVDLASRTGLLFLSGFLGVSGIALIVETEW